MTGKKALIAMSGGVDSSVAAFLMQQQGFDCCGGTLILCDAALTGQSVPSPVDDAQAVAKKMGIPFYIFDARQNFRDQVVEPFVASYESGLTPNPCIFCNQEIKFHLLLEKALSLGCQYIVTGHYARIRKDEITGRYLLHKASDAQKDQSYFLAGLTQHQLSHCQFPLGELTKEQVRAIAEEQGFLNARKKDSQDICFIPGGDYVTFMERYRGKPYPKGTYLDANGKEVGRHRGAVAYTLGQRKGLGLAMGAPVYVCGKDMQANTVTVGPESMLLATTLIADNWNFFPFEHLTQPIRANAKARYRHTPQPATVYPMENGKAKVVFDTPQRAITPGQAVVLYHEDMVIGSGTIIEAKK